VGQVRTLPLNAGRPEIRRELAEEAWRRIAMQMITFVTGDYDTDDHADLLATSMRDVIHHYEFAAPGEATVEEVARNLDQLAKALARAAADFRRNPDLLNPGSSR
jgi:predicted ArsR family transcriptional regulator